MTALCQKRTYAEQPFRLFDHLVGAGKQGGRNGESERLCGLYIDDELEAGRLLDWQVAGLLAFEDAVDVGTRAYKGQDRRRRKTPGLIFRSERRENGTDTPEFMEISFNTMRLHLLE